MIDRLAESKYGFLVPVGLQSLMLVVAVMDGSLLSDAIVLTAIISGAFGEYRFFSAIGLPVGGILPVFVHAVLGVVVSWVILRPMLFPNMVVISMRSLATALAFVSVSLWTAFADTVRS